MGSRRSAAGYLFFAPALIVFLLVGLYPILYQIYLSFTDWYLLRSLTPVWYGLDGYKRLLADTVLWESFLRTIIWTVGTVALEFVIGLLFALLLNRRSRINAILSGLILLPWVAPSIVVAYTWRWLLDGQYGALHQVLYQFGLVGERSLLVDPSLALLAVTAVSAWKGAPFMTIALLATLKSIPEELYEAAAVDGANLWNQFRFITFPLLIPVSVVMSLILGVLAFYSFDLVWIMTKGGPTDATLLLGVYLFRQFFERNELSYAATIGVAMLLLLLAFSSVYLGLLRKRQTA
ncbi:MAG: sugar ABC transporter permease [Caldilineaceae bacterium]|nr:sugar ABC transporter permease [Caldilineaceae bacterium]